GFFDQAPVRSLDRREVGIAFELERIERPHFVTAASAVAGAAPLPVRRLPEAGGALLFLRRALRRFFRAQVREIVPVLVVFGGVGLAEIPAFLAVRGFGRGLVADFAAPFAVAQAHPRRPAAFVAVGAPARESPVVRSLLLGHSTPL